MPATRRTLVFCSLFLVLVGLTCRVSRAQTPEPASPDLSNGLINPFVDLSLEELMGVEVTSVAGVKTGWFQSPAAMYVITAEDVRRHGHVLLPEALRLVPGATVGRINAQYWSIGFRGMDGLLSDKLLVMMDGRQIYEPAFGGVLWFMHDMVLTDLDRIEAIRGPGATLWGANAVNGVVNITAKSARDTQGLYVSGLAATDINGMAEFRYGGAIHDSTWYRVWGKFLDHDHFEEPDGTDGHDDWARVQGGMRLDHETDGGQLFTLDAAVAHAPRQEYGVNLSVPGPPPTGGGTVFTSFDNQFSAAHILGRLSEENVESGWSLQGYFDWADVIAVDDLNLNRYSIDTEWRHHFKWGARSEHELVWGLHYRADLTDFDNGVDYSFLPASRDHHRVDGFLQDTLELVPDQWFVMLGSKLEYNTHTGVEVQPSARLWWTPDDRNTLWAAVSRPVRTPHPLNEDTSYRVAQIDLGGGVVVPVNLTGDDDLDAEEILAFEAGYRSRLRDDLTLDVAAFHNQYHDLITVNPATLMNENNAEAQTVGGELVLTWRPAENLRVEGVYSYVYIDADDPSTPLHETTPPHQGRLSLAWDITKALEFNTAAYFISHRPDTTIGSYTRLDMGVTWRPRHNVEIALWGQNLLDSGHPEDNPSLADSSLTDIPRAAYIKATMRF